MSRLSVSVLPPMPRGMRVRHLGADRVLLRIPMPEANLPAVLTDAEREVARQVYAGASNAQIASRRGVSVRTVANQLDVIFRKLGLGSRVELVLYLQTADPA